MRAGKKRPSWQSDKESFNERDTQKKDEGRKGENPETIFDSDSPTVHTTVERYGLSDLVKGKAGVRFERLPQLCVCTCVYNMCV